MKHPSGFPTLANGCFYPGKFAVKLQSLVFAAIVAKGVQGLQSAHTGTRIAGWVDLTPAVIKAKHVQSGRIRRICRNSATTWVITPVFLFRDCMTITWRYSNVLISRFGRDRQGVPPLKFLAKLPIQRKVHQTTCNVESPELFLE